MKRNCFLKRLLPALILAAGIFCACSDDGGSSDSPAPAEQTQSNPLVGTWKSPADASGSSVTAEIDSKTITVKEEKNGKTTVIIGGEPYTLDENGNAKVTVEEDAADGSKTKINYTISLSDGKLSVKNDSAESPVDLTFEKQDAGDGNSSVSKTLVSEWVLTASDDPESDIGNEFIWLCDDGTFYYHYQGEEIKGEILGGRYEQSGPTIRITWTWASKELLGEAYDFYYNELVGTTDTVTINSNRFEIWGDSTFTLNPESLGKQVNVGDGDKQNKPSLVLTSSNAAEILGEDWKTRESIVIPSSVTSIGGGVFRGCTSFASVTIPEGVKFIGEGAFYACTSLASIAIPESVTLIESQAFKKCESLTSIVIPANVTSIKYKMFEGCNSLASVTLPEGVTSIGREAFNCCTSLESITIPANVTSIGYSAFRSCWRLESITIPEGVASIDNNMFEDCGSLTSVTIPSSVTTIGDSAFKGCKSLESVAIPEDMTSIGSYAFTGCTSLASITIPSSVISIGSSAFSGCTSLESVTVRAKTPPSVGSNVLSYASSSLKIYVPAASVGTYKTAAGWKDYADKIEAIQ